MSSSGASGNTTSERRSKHKEDSSSQMPTTQSKSTNASTPTGSSRRNERLIKKPWKVDQALSPIPENEGSENSEDSDFVSKRGKGLKGKNDIDNKINQIVANILAKYFGIDDPKG